MMIQEWLAGGRGPAGYHRRESEHYCREGRAVPLCLLVITSYDLLRSFTDPTMCIIHILVFEPNYHIVPQLPCRACINSARNDL